jgi:coproporphyrinogen III oxidase-like Fe-S oxidoreductase
MPSSFWSRTFLRDDQSDAAQTDRLGLYIHWPYCARICPYCDFNVYKAANGDPDGLLAAMLKDLEHWRGRVGPRELVSVHFGGGTPSLMAPQAVDAILTKADSLFGLADGAEIGLEANPAERERLPDLAERGDQPLVARRAGARR